MAAEAKTNGDAILLLDFANAFNTVSRNLLISLTARMCPELANLAWWLYKLEPRLLTATGEAVRSSSGTQQGCRLSYPLFALAMEYIAEKLEGIPGLRCTLFYWDDTALVGSPSALATAARIIADCAHETGLELRWKKCHLYGTPTTIDKCRSLQNPSFPTTITFHADLNIEYLKTPIGSDGFVNLWMTSKLQELTQAINSISAMKWKHEAATLLKHCGTFCRVVHLIRTVPPRQIEASIGELDSTIRGAFEGLLC